ncbi:hypothetical protein SCAZ3_03915 [Streptococcus canis FSL Z3-227]|uniref:Uncharacterized protein n=1 Tax=Streptococcus canis FSL Z3-227 TaxID=482234 RepID=A0AAV3FRD9_STRCB|nr:hypothetical protein SCAZ3_03915 [Streptococcus canis FSL Z3-227]
MGIFILNIKAFWDWRKFSFSNPFGSDKKILLELKRFPSFFLKFPFPFHDKSAYF